MADLARLATAGLRLLPAEPAHRLAIRLLRLGLVPRDREADDPILATRAFGLAFANPIGLAAGFDKNAEAFAPLLGLGFGFVEIGSVTPRPQPGNPKPRLFRLPPDRGLINRLGFNNDGLEAVADRLRRRRRGSGILGANLGKNKDSADAAADYRRGVLALARHADYLVVNVSSPNTPGLRALQGREPLDALLAAVQAARAEAVAAGGPPILLKIAPDLTAEDCRDIAEVVLARKLDGLIIGNTTITRPADLRGRHRGEAGGLSGRPLFPLATERLAEMYRLTGGRIPLIGTGGVASGAQAYAKIRAGAALVQLYTGLVYEGPGLVRRIKRELAALLRRDGFAGVAAAVGADHRPVGAPGAGRRIG
ncbi:MAG TPA: quinone-dependent dihydroorotate dehydrogenase [Alphaproteobacteria bacterium]|nr:quinone-dependent dihydroorotate dehydrogenase [Alphaproteobacteria bacterium]